MSVQTSLCCGCALSRGQIKPLMWSSDHLGSLAGLSFNYPVPCKCCAGQDDVGPGRAGEVAFVKRIQMMWVDTQAECHVVNAMCVSPSTLLVTSSARHP